MSNMALLLLYPALVLLLLQKLRLLLLLQHVLLLLLQGKLLLMLSSCKLLLLLDDELLTGLQCGLKILWWLSGYTWSWLSWNGLPGLQGLPVRAHQLLPWL